MSQLAGKNILITGGAGTLGMEIIRRAEEHEWGSRITIFSRDATKHMFVKRLYPWVDSVIGDIRDPVTLSNVMAGKDVVVHAAAVKHIPISEENSIDTFEINVSGSMNVALAAIEHNVEHVIGISTDKVCHAANAYGATKYLMEKAFQEFSRTPFPTHFHLVRYGNVLESTASVIKVWEAQISRGEPIRITNPYMTRFWLSPAHAAKLVEDSMMTVSGNILIPKVSALSIGKLMEYTIGTPPYGIENIPLRAGEKLHETLLSTDETDFAADFGDVFVLRPSTTERNFANVQPYSSNSAPELSKEELLELLKNDIPA